MSAQLTTVDLQFRYSATAVLGDNPRLRALDATFFNGHEQYEVLSFINSFLNAHTVDEKPMTKAHGLKIERMLQQKPGNIRSREHVKQWIENNWGAYN